MTTYFIGVACNDYPGINADLRGCLNDVREMERRAIERLGASTTLLLDKEATISRFEECVRDHYPMAHEGDLVILDYSLHGSQQLAVGEDLEPDGYDETLCFYPSKLGSYFKVADDYTDDQHGELLAGFRAGVRALAFGDLCHSGTFARNLMTSSPWAGTPYRKARFLPPDERFGLTGFGARLRNRFLGAREFPTPGGDGVQLTWLSGCADHEVSYDADFGGIYHGAMTRALLDTWDRAHAEGRALTGIEYQGAIQELLDSWGYPQHPELHAMGGARAEDPLFG